MEGLRGEMWKIPVGCFVDFSIEGVVHEVLELIVLLCCNSRVSKQTSLLLAARN